MKEVLFFMEVDFIDTTNIITSILKAHKLDLMPLYSINTVKLKK